MIPNKYNQKIEKKITYISIYGTIYRKMHPSGVTVEIVGISMNDRGRSCEEHDVCGSVLTEDSIVRFRKTQVIIDGREQSAIAGYWVSDGIDRCRIGFLPKHLVKHWEQYEGVLAQVTDIYSDDNESPHKRRKHHQNKGCCTAALISAPFPIIKQQQQLPVHVRKKRKTTTPNEEENDDEVEDIEDVVLEDTKTKTTTENTTD